MSTRRTIYALMAALIVSTATLWAQSQTPDERARELVNKMTLDEKIQELHGIKDSEHYRVVPGVPRLGIPDFHITNEEIDERALREIYLPAFEVSIKQGHSASVMCAYNKINGTFCCENDLIMNQILKKEWGFDGFITSDFGAVHSTIPSAMAGLDLQMPTGKYFGDDLKTAVESGKVPMSEVMKP